MQTFMTSKSYIESADCLDWQYSQNRLNTQINEVIVIEKTLLGYYENGNESHPAVRMWENYELSLLEYGQVCLATRMRKLKQEFDVRQEVFVKLQVEIINKFPGSYYRTQFGKYETNHPFWLGDERLHSSHRAVLLGKMPSWYTQFGWDEEPAVRNEKGKWPYFWPV